MTGLNLLRKHGAILVLAVLIARAVWLSLNWVFLVPIYQSPDEPAHLDFALCLNEHGRLFSGRDVSPPEAEPRSIHPFPNQPGLYVHPFTVYLHERTQAAAVAFHPDTRMFAGYGSAGFFDALDRDAPPRELFRLCRTPYMLTLYPFGYYALLAAWIGFLRLFSDSVVFLVFGCRLLSVLMLPVTLTLLYATARELGCKPWLALLLTAAIGLFPLTTFVTSYIQPDNLSFLMVALCLYLALRARRRPGSLWRTGLLGAALGVLLITKVHFWFCVFVPALAALAAARWGLPFSRRGWLAAGVLLVVPSLASGAAYLWTIRGVRQYLEDHPVDYSDPIPFAVQGIQTAFLDFYAGGTHDSFWGIFGWLDAPLTFGSPSATQTVQFIIQVGTWVVLGLTLMRLEQVASRLWRLTRRGRWTAALRRACSNPVMNSYFLFTVVMLTLHVVTKNAICSQGRHWLPFILPLFLTAVVYAPRALTLRRARQVVSLTLLGGLLLYAVVGSSQAPSSLKNRYYVSPRSLPASERPLRTARAGLKQLIWQRLRAPAGNRLAVSPLTGAAVDAK